MKCLLLFILLASAGTAQTLPPAPGADVFTVTPPGFANEPSIAINARNPEQVVVAWQKNASVAYSRDGGANWKDAAGTAPGDFRVSGDVSVTYDVQGHAILCYIAFDRLGTASYWGHNATRNGIFIRRSLDGGVNWEPTAIPVIAHATAPGIPFEDKPYIVADNTQSPHAGSLYVGWTQFTLTKSVILFSRSTDGGLHWSKPIEISSHAGLPRDDNGSVEGFTGAVARDGTLYVAWADDNQIAFTYSRDGGRTFARSRAVARTAPPYFQVDAVSRANGFPQIGWGPCPKTATGCTRAGVLYLTWSDYRNGDVDVFCSTSLDGGARWSKPMRVNSDQVHNGSDQFFQWLAVDPSDGAANVLFYDRRGDPANRKAIIVLARSTDGARKWENFGWTNQPFDARDDFLGDYTGLAALNGRVYGTWAEEVTPPAKAGAAPPTGAAGASTDKRPVVAAAAEQDDQTVSSRPLHRAVVRVGRADFSGRHAE